MDRKNLLTNFVASRQNSVPIIAAFGYGSGIFKQKGYDLQKNMIDTIFIVEDSMKWHKENKKKNPKDYPLSAKILLGNINIDKISLLSGITYQTNITFNACTFKYGVISENVFLEQMTSWNKFFLPGRFQKPIYPIQTTDCINLAIEKNRKTALLISLLTLPEDKKTIRGLFMHLCSLSYLGDIRMLFVENPNKIANIVEAEFALFLQIYGRDNEYFFTKRNGEIVINYDKLLLEIENLLPKGIKKNLDSNNPYLQEQILKYIKHENLLESIIQPMMGILTSGPITSFKYAKQKMSKRK